MNTEANYTVGQRVYVSGRLFSNHVTTNEGKQLTCSRVKASKLYVLENDSASIGSVDGDINHVEIVANIATDIIDRGNFTSFSVATHFDIR